MEIENIIDLCLAGQIELVEEVLKELPKLEKATSSYVRKMYGWAKPFAKMHGQQELPKSVFNGMDLLFVDELFFDWYNKSTKKHKNVSVAALPEKLKMPPKIHSLVFYRIVWEELPAVLFDDQIKKIVIRDCPFKTIPALPTKLKSFEIYRCKNIEKLPELPSTLETFECYNNRKMAFPTCFPANMKFINLKR